MPSLPPNIMPWDVDAYRADEGIPLMSPVGRVLLDEVLMVMWKQGRSGELSGSILDLAKLCRLSPAEARAGVDQIKARNVMDVTEGNGHVTLVSRRMKRDAEKRKNTAERVRKHRSKGSGNDAGNAAVTQGVTRLKHPDAGVTPPPPSSPPPSLSPTPPLTTTPTPTPSPGSANAAAPPSPPAGPAVAELSDLRSATGGGRKAKGRTLSPEQSAAYHGLIAWWCDEGYPAAMQGLVYPFDGANDGRAVKRLLSHAWVAWDLERAKAVALAYLRSPDQFIARQNRPLSLLGNQLQTWVLQAQKTPAQQAARQESNYARNRNDRRDDGTREGEHAPRPAVVAKPRADEPEQLRDELFGRFGVTSNGPAVGVGPGATGRTAPAVSAAAAGSAGGGPERRGGGADAA